MGKTCTPCAAKGRFTFTPCNTHDTAQDAATCTHELTSETLTHNGHRDDILCHGCGSLLIWSGVITR